MQRFRLASLAVIATATAMLVTGCSSGGGTEAVSAPTSATSATGTSHHYTVAIAVSAQIKLLTDMVASFKNELTSEGLISGKNVSYVEQNANGNTQNYSLIASQELSKKPDLVYVIGTPLVQAFQADKPTMPVLFGAVTDPVGAGFVKSLQSPGGNMTGSSDFVSADATLQVIHDSLPKAKTIGVMGNMGEPNTATQVKQLQDAAKVKGYTIVVAPVANTNSIPLALTSLRSRVDALFVGTDNTVNSALATVAQTALADKIPFVFGAGASNQPGIFVSFGADYDALGKANGTQAAKILLHHDVPNNMPVATTESTGGYSVAIMAQTAKDLGLEVPATVLGTKPTVY